LPPGPEQVAVYVVLAIKLPVETDPDVPVQFDGVTVHEVAAEVVQAMVAAELYAIVQLAAPLQVMVPVGRGGGETVTAAVWDGSDPLGPVQLIV
jgi:threonine synthase